MGVYLYFGVSPVDEYALKLVLGVQSLHLFEDDKGNADGADDCEGNESHDEAQQRVGNDERQDGTACSDGCPGNVATTKAHEFKGSLQPLENWVLRVAGVHCAVHQNPVITPSSMPKNRGRAWAAAIKNTHAPMIIMIDFFTSCSSLFIFTYTEMAPTMATTPAMA